MVTVCYDCAADEFTNADDEKYFFTCFKDLENADKDAATKVIAGAAAIASSLFLMAWV